VQVGSAGRSPRLDALPARELSGGLRVARAGRSRERLVGLARLDAMPDDRGLHLPRCRSVHTLGMRFPLDLIWLGADGRPLRIDRNVPPRRFRACLRARSVVEVNAGTADAFLAAGLRAGLSG
jgi:uncharacterized membrane protein (UPF0127 family)